MYWPMGCSGLSHNLARDIMSLNYFHNKSLKMLNSLEPKLMLFSFLFLWGRRTEAGVWSRVPGSDVTGLCWRSSLLSPLQSPSLLFSEPLWWQEMAVAAPSWCELVRYVGQHKANDAGKTFIWKAFAQDHLKVDKCYLVFSFLRKLRFLNVNNKWAQSLTSWLRWLYEWDKKRSAAILKILSNP